MVQAQVINSRLAMANVLQNTQQQQQQHHHEQQQVLALMQPAYSNNSSASNNLINISNFTSNFNSGFVTNDTLPSSLHNPRFSREDDDDEQDSTDIASAPVFPNHILHRRS
ncbi:LOB domain-containing protein 20-like [Carica papaya]|uniref:LOB domain-containing protein 20-like n=1 Tax=Carica papaya TaxID=3649 RepID=UPI000B8C74CF|nr:LOB domain-containing protein 20-like [Carica papaya]